MGALTAVALVFSAGIGGGAIDVAGGGGVTPALDVAGRIGLAFTPRVQIVLDVAGQAPFGEGMGCGTGTLRLQYFLLGDARSDGLSVSLGGGIGSLSKGS